MKKALILTTFLCLSIFTYADDDHSHNANVAEETLYYTQESSNSLREKAFEYIIINEKNGNKIISPLGDTRYPYSAIGEISRIMPVGGGQVAFQMSRVKASFDQHARDVEDAFSENQFFAVEESMIFLLADGVTITTIENATYVIIPELVNKDLEELLQIKWNECGNRYFRGNYDDGSTQYNCSRNRMMHDQFRGLLEQNLLSCVNEGLETIDRPASPDLYMVHKGTAADRLHSSGSMHQQGKAIDIRIIRVTGADGEQYDINYAQAVRGTPGWRFKFYQSFRTCWGKVQLERSPTCSSNNMRYNRSRNLPYYGSIGWEDSRHKVHLHISMPPCGTRRL